MVNKILFWGGFGVAVRLWQLGLQMRPLFVTKELWAYPFYASFGGVFGYWLQGVEGRQQQRLLETREKLLEKRKRQAEREERESTEEEHRPVQEARKPRGVFGLTLKN